MQWLFDEGYIKKYANLRAIDVKIYVVLNLINYFTAEVRDNTCLMKYQKAKHYVMFGAKMVHHQAINLGPAADRSPFITECQRISRGYNLTYKL